MAPAGEFASRCAQPVSMLIGGSSPVAVMQWQLATLPYGLLCPLQPQRPLTQQADGTAAALWQSCKCTQTCDTWLL